MPNFSQVRDHIARFLSEPSSDTYEALREAVLGHAEYQPDSDALVRFCACLDGPDPELARPLISALFPTFLLHPGTHSGLAYFHRRTGDEQGREFEQFFSHQLHRFLLASGDGSPHKPFRVSCVDEEYCVADSRQARIQGVACEWVEGRFHDVLVTDRGRLHFDIHDILAAYA